MSNFKIYHEDKGFIFMNGALTEVKLLYTNFLKLVAKTFLQQPRLKRGVNNGMRMRTF